MSAVLRPVDFAADDEQVAVDVARVGASDDVAVDREHVAGDVSAR